MRVQRLQGTWFFPVIQRFMQSIFGNSWPQHEPNFLQLHKCSNTSHPGTMDVHMHGSDPEAGLIQEEDAEEARFQLLHRLHENMSLTSSRHPISNG